MDPKYFYIKDFKPLCSVLRMEDALYRVHFVEAKVCPVSLNGPNLSPPKQGFESREIWIIEENNSLFEGFYTVNENNYLLRLKN